MEDKELRSLATSPSEENIHVGKKNIKDICETGNCEPRMHNNRKYLRIRKKKVS